LKHIAVKNNSVSRVGLVIATLALVFGFSFPASAASVEGDSRTEFISSESLMVLVNKERAKKDLPILIESELLEKAAESKASDMMRRGYFSHTSPDGRSPWYWFREVGYRYQAAGENLAIQFFDSKEAVRAWMSSPEHRENILSRHFTQIGMAVREGIYKGKESVVVVQFFGKPHKFFF
jgi:uncharacterized protein YkwD